MKIKIATNALAIGSIVFLSMFCFGMIYSGSDLALIAFIPLAVIIIVSSYYIYISQRREILKIAIKEASPLSFVLKGKILSTAGAVFFSFTTIYLLAWYTLSSSFLDVVFAGIISIVTAYFSAITYIYFLKHFTHPFARCYAITCTTVITAFVFIPLMGWWDWNFTQYPLSLQNLSLIETIHLGWRYLPYTSGWLTELLRPMYAIDFFKLWFVIQPNTSSTFSIWYSLDTALAVLVIGRASALIMMFFIGILR